MPSIGSLCVRAAAAALLTLTVATDLHAQNPQPLPTPPSSMEFLSRYDFFLSAAGLSDPDPRFAWDAHWGGDFDFIDYVRGRMMFLADYQAVLGNELQLFDPNQGNYRLAVSFSLRFKGNELAAVLDHVSRHLGDRPNRKAVARNALEVRLLRQFDLGKQTLSLRVEGGPVTARSFVDYRAIGLVDTTLRRQLTPRTGVYGRIYADYYVIDPAIAGRSNQNGGRFEAGVRIAGKAGKLDLFGGYENVVDAYPVERQSRDWAFAGFRLVN